MTQAEKSAGTFRLPGTELSLNRMGYGAMRLSGPQIFGPPKDRAQAVAVLRAAVAAGVNHIDTSDFYGPHVTNQIIREALHPYTPELTLVTKVGAKRGPQGEWLPAAGPEELIQAVHDNLRNLGVEVLDVVNLRLWGTMHGPSEEPLSERLSVLVDLQQKGLIKHLGVSNVTPAQVKEARSLAPIVCVQNHYNLAHRHDDSLIDELAGSGIAYVPYFPLGGFTPLQSSTLSEVAARLETTPMQVALAWLLHRSSNILLIPGTSSLEHLSENLAAASLVLPAEELERLNAMTTASHHA